MTSKTTASTSPVLASVRRDIETMRTRGAGEIGKQAVLALASAAQGYDARDMRSFQESLIEAARLLAGARPTAVSLRNGLNTVLSATLKEKDATTARATVQKAADDFAKRIDAAKAKIADLGQTLVGANETILTHCHSTAAGELLARVQEAGKRPRVFATETRPFRQGLITARELAARGIDVTLIVDSAIAHILREEDVTHVVIGADTVAADGSLYNKVGTSLVCLAANVLDIPVIVAAESYKFSPYTLQGEAVVVEERSPDEIVPKAELPPNVKVRNPVFDRTAPELITTYVTEEGLIKPSEVRVFIERIYGGVKRWI